MCYDDEGGGGGLDDRPRRPRYRREEPAFDERPHDWDAGCREERPRDFDRGPRERGGAPRGGGRYGGPSRGGYREECRPRRPDEYDEPAPPPERKPGPDGEPKPPYTGPRNREEWLLREWQTAHEQACHELRVEILKEKLRKTWGKSIERIAVEVDRLMYEDWKICQKDGDHHEERRKLVAEMTAKIMDVYKKGPK